MISVYKVILLENKTSLSWCCHYPCFPCRCHQLYIYCKISWWWSPNSTIFRHAGYICIYIYNRYKLYMKILFDMIAPWHKKLWSVAFNKWGRIRWWKFPFLFLIRKEKKPNHILFFYVALTTTTTWPKSINFSDYSICRLLTKDTSNWLIKVHWDNNTCVWKISFITKTKTSYFIINGLVSLKLWRWYVCMSVNFLKEKNYVESYMHSLRK